MKRTQSNEKALSGKSAVITGGTRGLGLAMARAYTQAGARVVVASRSQAAVDQAVEILHQEDGEASGVTCDVGDRQQVEALAKFAIQTYGQFDIWVNNAGITAPYGPTVHIEPDAFVTALKTNIFGVYYGSIFAMRHFLPRRSGKLLNILGRGDTGPVPMQNAYASSKAWVRAFTLALAKEYKQSGVGIFAYNPGLMHTDLMEKIDAIAGYEDRLTPLTTVMEMWANPPSVPAERAVWLASSATDGRTGLEIKELDLLHIVSGIVRLGMRRLMGFNGSDYQMQVHSLKPSIQIPTTSAMGSGKGSSTTGNATDITK
jgi:NAD(P)-dependent dehydrogenase (short-subunit alcohol dehydrogenase family)